MITYAEMSCDTATATNKTTMMSPILSLSSTQGGKLKETTPNGPTPKTTKCICETLDNTDLT